MRNKIFALLVVVLLGTGISLLFSSNTRTLKIENRTPATISNVETDSFYDGTLKDELSDIISDQMYYRDNLITYYNQYKRTLNESFYTETETEEEEEETKVTTVSDELVEFGDGYLTKNISSIDWEAGILSATDRGYNLFEFHKKYPDVKMYVYMPTKIEQTNLIDDQFTENRFDEMEEAFVKQLWNQIKFKKLEINTIEDYEKYFYRIDIHWNARGAYQGYTDIIEMFQEDFDIEDAKEILRFRQIGHAFYGSNARLIGNAVKKADHITDVDLGITEDQYTYYFEGNYHSIEEVKQNYLDCVNSGLEMTDDYINYFDTFTLRRVFDFHQEDKPNLLIFGDSFVNPVMSWIASHFNKTVVLDLRCLADDEDFSLSEIMEKYEIDAVLNLEYYDDLFFNGYCFIPLDS